MLIEFEYTIYKLFKKISFESSICIDIIYIDIDEQY